MEGDQVHYNRTVTLPTAEQPLAKLMINSTLSTKNTKFGSTDIKDLFLKIIFSSKSEYTYMKLSAKHIKKVIINNYNLMPLTYNSYVYCEITGRIYGLSHTTW